MNQETASVHLLESSDRREVRRVQASGTSGFRRIGLFLCAALLCQPAFSQSDCSGPTPVPRGSVPMLKLPLTDCLNTWAENNFWFGEGHAVTINGMDSDRRWSIGLGNSPWYSSFFSVVDTIVTASDQPCGEQDPACWRIDPQLSVLMQHTTPVWGNTRGFPLNLDVYNLPATTNYPPLSHEAWASTSPFVSVPGDQTYRPLFLADRKVVAGVIDPMTGQPLIREVDLELPVGRATFRMVRTYGGNADGSVGRPGKILDGQGDRLAIGKLWDWAGTGWMISENPILLFDAQYIQHEPNGPRRCFLILDAHHSIPFTQDVQTGNYIAPAWFDAIMTWREPEGADPVPAGVYHEATGDSPARWEWTQQPASIKVRLQGESVTYKFRIQDEPTSPLTDVAGNLLAARAHASPRVTTVGGLVVHPPSQAGGGLGTPLVALLESIVDRFGNRAVISHCPIRKYSVNPGEECESCVHTCAERGQIQRVKLYRRVGETETLEWTLLYVHRSFRTWAPDLWREPSPWPPPPVPAAAEGALPVAIAPELTATHDAESKWFLQNALHAVFVYKGDDGATVAENENAWTLPADAFVIQSHSPLVPYPSLDVQDDPNWTEGKIQQYLNWAVPDNWRYRIRFTYDETIKPLGACHSPRAYWMPADASGQTCCVPDPDPEDPDSCLDVAGVTPAQYTEFGSERVSDVPGILFWGTPLKTRTVTRNNGDLEEVIAPRITPCLLRVEKTERTDQGSDPEPSSDPGHTTYTGYLYATHLDEPTRLLHPSEWQSPSARALGLDGTNCFSLEGQDDHTYERVVPKLKHILRDDRLRRAMKDNNSTSINSVFDPTSESTERVARNRRSYAEMANLTLDWQPLRSHPTGWITSERPTAGQSLWVRLGLIGQCVLSQVERKRIFVRDGGGQGVGLVGRVRIQDGGAADGTYDLMYLGVHPPSFEMDFGIGPPDCGAGLCTQRYTEVDLPDTYTLFPFSWRRLAINDSLQESSYTVSELIPGPNGEPQVPLVPAPLDQPMFITMVDRHDGACAGKGPRKSRRPYMMRYLYLEDTETLSDLYGCDADGIQNHIMVPQQRQVVGLNPAGLVLFERNWDYQAGGFDAFGPTEQFVYEQTNSSTPDGNGGQLNVEIGLRLKEHRTLGWGVGYIYDIQGGMISSGGCQPGCNNNGNCVSADRGLIRLYDYLDYEATDPDYPSNPQRTVQSGLVTGVSVKEGLNGAPRHLSDMTYDDNQQVKSRRWFVLDAGGAEQTTMGTNRHVAYYLDSDGPDSRKRIKRETNSQAPASPWPGAVTRLMPFESKFFNKEGLLIGRSYGLCEGVDDDGVPIAAADASTIYVDVYGYDAAGRKVIEIVDADIKADGTGTAAAEALGDEWSQLTYGTGQERLPTSGAIGGYVGAVAEFAHRELPDSTQHLSPPLNRTTAYAYDGEGRLEIVSKPDGRYDFYVVRPVHVLDSNPPEPGIDDHSARISTVYLDAAYIEVAPATESAPATRAWVTRKAGQLATVLSGRTMRTWSVQWDGSLSIADGVPTFAQGTGLQATPEMFKAQDSNGASVSLDLPDGITNHVAFTTIAAVVPEYDQAGRPTKVRAVGLTDDVTGVPRTEEIQRVATYTDFGLVDKRIEPSQTLRRTVSSPLGQVIAEFKGTSDRSLCWQEHTGTDNMALTARHVYGEGINNIRQPVLTRRYRNLVLCNQTDYHGRGGSGMLSDITGWEEAYGYDRRGRRCAAEVYGQPTAGQLAGHARPQPDPDPRKPTFGEADTSPGDSRKLLRAEYTWYDHQDRVRFTAVFAPSEAEAMRTSAVNPRGRDVYTLGDPTAQDILAAHPLRLTENLYNDRGQLEETIEYDTEQSAQLGVLAHQSTRMYYDHNGSVTVRISSSGRWERMTYDALGRLVSTSVMRGELPGITGDNGYEIERTDNAYHENGQVERTSHIVRINAEPGPADVSALTSGPGGNAVRTDTLTWYDDEARPIATASLGTGWFEATPDPSRPNGVFANLTADPPEVPSKVGSVFGSVPTWNDVTRRWEAGWMGPQHAEFAQISTTAYDNAGRIVETRAPSGSRTAKIYDGLGRVVMEQTFPAGNQLDLNAAQVVAYHYRDGRLVKIGAPHPGHFTTDSPFPRFHNNDDPTIQITELVYGESGPNGSPGTSALIIDPADGSTVSADYDLLRGIRFPAGGCACDVNGGGVSVQDLFDFLALYFALDPEADFNGSGDVTVQDLFDFLACYFSAGSDCARVWDVTVNDGLDIQFEYTLDGMIHSRSELARVPESTSPVKRTLRFSYDQLGRRTGMDVVSGGVDVADSVERTRFFYDPLDRLVKATAEAQDRTLGCFYPVATSLFEHDSFGNLLSERLLHGAAAESSVAALQYQWQYTVVATGPPSTPAAGPLVVPRLAAMDYPWGAGADGSAGAGSQHRGRLDYGYGTPYTGQADASWVDDSLHRVQSLAWRTAQDGSGSSLPIAKYAYAGAAMRAGLTLGPSTDPGTQPDAIVQDFAHGNGDVALLTGHPALSGLDRFGRVRDLNYLWGLSPLDQDTRARRQLQYDDFHGGTLIGERVTQQQATGGGGGGGGGAGTTGSDRSWTYTYDGFSRLVSAAGGTLNASWGFDAVNTRALQQSWTLDELGNWTVPAADTTGLGFHEQRFDALGNPTGIETGRTHKTDARNEVDSQVYALTDHSTAPPAAAEPLEIDYAYDPAGRMVYDGRVVYDHDALGRVVRVRRMVGEPSFNPDGTYNVPASGQPGRLIAHYSYDALGRLIRTQRPNSASGERLAITDLYYDGVRVVQEVGWASVAGRVPGGAGGGGGGAGAPFLARPAREVVGDGATGQLPSGESGACSLPTPNPSGDWAWSDRRLEREYLWHADPGAYVDDCAAELVYTDAHAWNGLEDAGDDAAPTVLYVLSDANADVIALTDAIGRVVAQYGYTPYGDLLAAERFVPGSDSLATESHAAAIGSRLGHQGLRTERFDRPWDGPLDIGSAVPIGTEATGPYRSLCHNRNRLYDPAEGRFTGNDPNGLGLPVLSGLAFGGVAIHAFDVTPDVEDHYADGMNAHVAYGSAPLSVRDPQGLVGIDVFTYAIGPGFRIGALAFDLVNTYADNESWNAEWAGDWSLPDDWHTRTNNAWLGEILQQHAESWIKDTIDPFSAWEDLWDLGVDLLGGGDQFMAGSASVTRQAVRTIRVGGRVVRGLAHLHHLLPKYLGRILRIQSKVVARVPVALHGAYHVFVSRGMTRLLGCPAFTAPRDAWRVWAEANPSKLRRVLPTLKRLTKDFERRHNVSGLSEGMKQAIEESFDLD